MDCTVLIKMINALKFLGLLFSHRSLDIRSRIQRMLSRIAMTKTRLNPIRDCIVWELMHLVQRLVILILEHMGLVA